MSRVPARMRALLSLSILAALALTAGCRRDSSYETCTPGNSYLVGCSRNVGLECSGDPTITVCTDDITPSQCLNSVPERIAFNDDSGGTLCSEVTFVCPSSGRVSVNAEPFASRSYRCVYDVIDLSP